MNNATLNSTTLSGTPSVTINSGSAGDIGCTVVTSDYKWLTKKMKTTQTNLALRPFYTCQVIDDSLVPNQILVEPNQPMQGSAVIAPDGSTLAVGLNLAGNAIGFWKIADASNSSLWSASPTVTLDSTASHINALNHYAIQVSDYIQGQYVIDVYYFGNFGGGGGSFLTIIHQQSRDSGATWSSAITCNATQIPYAATANFWIASGKPYQDNSGNIISTVFYIGPDGSFFDVTYQQYPGTGSTFNNQVHWGKKNINTRDWILHSLDVTYIDNYWYVAFSGYHAYYEPTNQDTTIKNYNIYITKILNLQNDETLDIWTPEFPIITSVSSSTQNKNSFTLPSLFYDNIGSFLYILFEGAIVTSIVDTNTANNVETTTNFYMAQSKDFKNFSYPNPVLFTDGSAYSNNMFTSFFRVGNYFYLAGSGQLWQYLLRNIVADVSSDILGYQVNDNQQSSSNIQLSIGNANNKWMGASPTQNGYQALAKNKKINLFQGYYTGDSTTEVVPKNTFYIDDIQNNITTSRNDLQFAGRDLYKLLNVLQTKFAYNLTGIKSYVDIYDGTTAGNYNVLSGDWDFGISNANTLSVLTQGQTESDVVFSLYQQTEANTIFCVVVAMPVPSNSGSSAYIYFYYVSPTSYARLTLTTNGSGTNYNWSIDVNGVSVQSGTFLSGSTDNFPFYIVRQSYAKFQCYRGTDATAGEGIASLHTLTSMGTQLDLSLTFTSLGTIALGCKGTIFSFKNFRYFEFASSQNMTELIKTIGTKCGIYDYVMPNQFTDYFFTDTNYNGPYSLVNRNLMLPISSTTMKTDLQIDNGDISFEAICSPLSTASEFYFDVIFRNTGLVNNDNNYFVRIDNNAGFISANLYATYLGFQYLIAATGLSGTGSNSLLFDITKKHKYRVLFYSSYIFFMIDETIVLSWFDNNTTNIQTTGYIGFRSSSNSTLVLSEVIGIDLWTQINNFSINPGDDLETSIEALLRTLRAYMFSDLFGRMKVVLLDSNDPSTYTYENQMILQQSDLSDKEYVNRVTIVGFNNITATAQDASSIATSGLIREEVINDNTITTYADAYTRAIAELTNYNKFNTQYSPKQVNNIGSEVYDVVHVINTGSNSSNVDAVVRNYSQVIESGGNSQSYWLQINVGTL